MVTVTVYFICRLRNEFSEPEFLSNFNVRMILDKQEKTLTTPENKEDYFHNIEWVDNPQDIPLGYRFINQEVAIALMTFLGMCTDSTKTYQYVVGTSEMVIEE